MTRHVTYSRDDNETWLAVSGRAHTDGRTIAAARRRSREAIALVENLPPGAEDTIELEETFELPNAGIESAIRGARAAREVALG